MIQSRDRIFRRASVLGADRLGLFFQVNVNPSGAPEGILRVAPGDMARRPRVTAEKAALAAWLLDRTTVSLRRLAARLELGQYTNAGRGPRRWNVVRRRRYDQALAKLQDLATKEISG